MVTVNVSNVIGTKSSSFHHVFESELVRIFFLDHGLELQGVVSATSFTVLLLNGVDTVKIAVNFCQSDRLSDTRSNGFLFLSLGKSKSLNLRAIFVSSITAHATEGCTI